MSRTLHRVLVITAMLGAAMAIAVALAVLKPAPEQRDAEIIPALVEVMELETATARFDIRSQGTVRPRTQTALSAEIAGSIVSVSPKFVAGGVFDKGEVLLRIDPTPYEAAVERAEALLGQRKIEHDGAKSLRSQGYRAEAEFASAVAALADARANLVTAKRDLEKTRIRLPYAGMVRAKEADIGQYVSPGSRLGVVFATDYAEVRLPLTDEDLAFVDLPAPGSLADEQGPEVELSATRHGRDATWFARITRSEGVIDEQTRVTYAVARIDDPYRLQAGNDADAPLPMGSFVSASIAGTTVDDVIRVPRAALRGRDQLVFVDDNERLRIRTVDILRTDADTAWVAAGASAGERISVTRVESPVNGMQVRVTGRNGDTPDSTLARSKE